MPDPSSADRPVVTRIAPSPTGYMHIGTARTALFNWLYARRHGGTYLLRIEDTDRERSTEAAVQAIFDGMKWLGIEPDAEPVFQHKRIERHKEIVQHLLETGRAYRCYMTAEELDAERQLARAEGRAIRSPWRDRDPPHGLNEPFVVRFRGPQEGETVIEDLIRGPVTFRNQGIGDIVLLRSNGAPVYNLAVVVDDHDMGITHVIRGDDHISNTPTQSQIYDAMSWAKPAFAHVPMIHGPDGAKLSKRHGAQAVGEFAEMGYLPEAMRNYLARLGWSHGDDEIFSDEEAIGWFDVADVGRSPARLDWNKLGHVNNHYIRLADDARLADLVAHVHRERGVRVSAAGEEALARIIPLVKEGAKTLLELADLTVFVLKTRPLELDERTQGLLTEETRERLGRLSARLGDEFEWTPPLLEAALRDFAANEGVGLGKFGGALRATLSGGAPAPDLGSTLAALGKDEALGRLDDALSQVR